VQLVLEQPERTAHTNIGPTETILRRLAARPRRLFLASTSEVYGKNPTMPLREDDDLVLGPPTKSRWIYACSKALDEYLALAAHRRAAVPVVIGRFFNVVGPRQVGRYGMVLPRFVEQALKGGPLVVHGDGAQVRCFAHVCDVVRAVRALMRTPAAAGQVFNIGSDQPVSIRALAEAVVELVDPKLAIEHIPYEQAFDAGFEDIRCRIPDLARMRAAIGFEPRHTLRDIVREVIAWRRGQLEPTSTAPSD
jgi:UDP-glucose 4-epimerase